MNKDLDTRPMKALQILQTLFLIAIMGMSGWIWHTTVESSNRIAALTQQLESMAREQNRQGDALQKLTDSHYELEHRVTVLEGRVK